MAFIPESEERERIDVKELILDAARELFVELGYDRVSMRKVAQRIYYSPTAIYLHFTDKEALFHELCSRDFLKLATAFGELSSIADPGERLYACGRTYIEFAVSHPNHYRFMFMTPVDLPLSEGELQHRGNPEEDAYAFLRSLVVECQRAALFSPSTDVDLIAQTLWAAVHGVAALEITACKTGWTDWRSLKERCDFMLASVMYGIPSASTETRK